MKKAPTIKAYIMSIVAMLIILSAGLFSHYWLVYKDYLFIQVPFVTEDDKIFAIDLIARIKAEKIQTSLRDFIQDGNKTFLPYAQFLEALESKNLETLGRFNDPVLLKSSPQTALQVNKDLIATWETGVNTSVEYLLQGEKYSYLVLSYLKEYGKFWFYYQFSKQNNQYYVFSGEEQTVLNSLVTVWVVASSKGGHFYVPQGNINYDAKPISYRAYWTKVRPLNSLLNIGKQEESLSLYFNSYSFEEGRSDSAAELKDHYVAFVTSIKNKDPEKLKASVTGKMFNRIVPLFEEAYIDNYRDFIAALDEIEMASFIDAHPLKVVYFRAPKGLDWEPLMAITSGGKTLFGEMGFYSQSSDLFRINKLKTFMVER